MSAGFPDAGYFDIRATHRAGRRLRSPLIYTNERSFRLAKRALARAVEAEPSMKFVLVRRYVGGEEIVE